MSLGLRVCNNTHGIFEAHLTSRAPKHSQYISITVTILHKTLSLPSF